MAKKFDRLRTHIPAAYRPKVNKFIKGLLEAWGTGDDSVSKAIAETKAQLFVATASQEFLDRLGSNVGVERPASLGIGDINFRNLVPALSYAPKQIRDVINKLLEIWYKSEAVFANMVSTVFEPYNLSDGDTLKLVINKTQTVEITFQTSDFLNISAATAVEVANAINKQSIGLLVKASEFNDSVLGRRFVRIRSTTPGATGEVRVGGGIAQNILKFPVVRSTTQIAGTQWDITLVTGDTIRMEYTGVGQSPNLSAVNVGDLVVVSGPFDNSNIGSFLINDVVLNASVDGITPGRKFTGNYVEFANIQAVVQTVTQTADLDVAFYFPKRHDVNTFPRPAVLYETNHKEVVVILPASAAVIGRNEKGSAHIHPNTELQTLLINNANGSSFEQGDEIIGINSFFMNNGSGDFVQGETITGGTSLATTTIFRPINNDNANKILAVLSVVGGFIVGETVTGSVSGATGKFIKTITTTSANGVVDAVLETNRKFGLQDLQGTFITDEGILGKTEMRHSFSTGHFTKGELLTSASSMSIIAPYLGSFIVSETVQGSVSGATATVTAILRQQLSGNTTLQITPLAGTFSSGEIVNGLASTAFGTIDSVVLASGATARIKELGSQRAVNQVNTINQQTGVFKGNEIIIGGSSGSKALIGGIVASVGIFEAIDQIDNFKSPYVFDVAAPFSPSSLSGATTEVINAGQPQSTIDTSALPAAFPNKPGFFILDMGTSNEEGPIRYIAKPTDNSIMVDPSFIYQKDHPIGSNLRFLNALEPVDIRTNGNDFAAYVTGLAEARVILQALIREVVATGVTVRFIVVFPEYAFQCFNSNELI